MTDDTFEKKLYDLLLKNANRKKTWNSDDKNAYVMNNDGVLKSINAQNFLKDPNLKITGIDTSSDKIYLTTNKGSIELNSKEYNKLNKKYNKLMNRPKFNSKQKTNNTFLNSLGLNYTQEDSKDAKNYEKMIKDLNKEKKRFEFHPGSYGLISTLYFGLPIGLAVGSILGFAQYGLNYISKKIKEKEAQKLKSYGNLPKFSDLLFGRIDKNKEEQNMIASGNQYQRTRNADLLGNMGAAATNNYRIKVPG